MYACCVQKVSPEARPVWFVFTGMGSQWPRMGRDLMNLDCFRESIVSCHAALRSFGIDLLDLLTNSKEDTLDSIENSSVGILAIQVISYISDSRKTCPYFDFCVSFSLLTNLFVSPHFVNQLRRSFRLCSDRIC